MKKVKENEDRGKRKAVIPVRMPQELLKEIKELADENTVEYSTMIRILVVEAIKHRRERDKQ